MAQHAGPDDGFRAGNTEVDTGLTQTEISDMDASEVLRELKDRLDSLKAAEWIVGTEADVLLRFCMRVKNNEIHGYTTGDEDYQRLVDIVHRKVQQYRTLAQEWHDIEGEIQVLISQWQDDADRGILEEVAPHIAWNIETAEQNLENTNELARIQQAFDVIQWQFTKAQRDAFTSETTVHISEIIKLLGQDASKENNDTLNAKLIEYSNDLKFESRLITRNNYIIRLEEIESELSEIDTGFAESRSIPEDIKSALTLLFEEEFTGPLEENTSRAEVVNWEISELMMRIETEVIIRNGISSRELTSEELAELTQMRQEYESIRWTIGEKLGDYLNSEVMPEPFWPLVTRYNRITRDFSNTTDSQEYDTLKDIVIPNHNALNRDIDITLRDEWMVWPNWERLWQLRLEWTNEAYNRILENAEIKEAITSNAGETPTFEQLDMNHINILKEKWVNLAELFLVNGDGTSFSWAMQQWESYIINFWGNENLPGKLDFAFLTHEVEQISIDWTVFTFDETTFNKDPASFAMQDGSKIDIVKLFWDTGEPSETQREAAIDGALEQYATSATQRQAVREALQSNSPNTRFEWDTLPKWILGAIIAMILNYWDGRNFKYDPETGTWKEWEDEATNNDMIASTQWSYRYNGNTMNMSASFENLDPWVGWLVNIVYQAEAWGDPNIIYSGCRIRPPRPITDMTVRELQVFQDEMVAEQNARWARNVSSAIWACQVIRSTLDAAVNSGLLDLDEKFDVDAQMRFTVGKMEERWLRAFQNGTLSEAKFMSNLAHEWASLPVDSSWRWAYDWHAGNRALVSPEVIQNQLRQIKAW